MDVLVDLPKAFVVTPITSLAVAVAPGVFAFPLPEEIAHALLALAQTHEAMTLDVACRAIALDPYRAASVVAQALRLLGYKNKRHGSGSRSRVWVRDVLVTPPVPTVQVVIDHLEAGQELGRHATRREKKRGWVVSDEGAVGLGDKVTVPDPEQVRACDAWLRVFAAAPQGRRAHDMPRTARDYADEASRWVRVTGHCDHQVGLTPILSTGAMLQALDDLEYRLDYLPGGEIEPRLGLKTQHIRAVRKIPEPDLATRDHPQLYNALSLSLMARWPSWVIKMPTNVRLRLDLDPSTARPIDPPYNHPAHPHRSGIAPAPVRHGAEPWASVMRGRALPPWLTSQTAQEIEDTFWEDAEMFAVIESTSDLIHGQVMAMTVPPEMTHRQVLVAMPEDIQPSPALATVPEPETQPSPAPVFVTAPMAADPKSDEAKEARRRERQIKHAAAVAHITRVNTEPTCTCGKILCTCGSPS